MLPPHTTVDMKNAAIAAVDTADGLDASTLPMVSYGFTTSQHNHALVARTLSTFAAGIPANLIVVATTDAASWKIDASRGLLPNVTVFKTNCREKPIDLGRGFDQACKSTMLLRRQFAVAPHAEWYARVADDCFFVPSHVQRALHMFNPARRIYGGCADYRFGDPERHRRCSPVPQSPVISRSACSRRLAFRPESRPHELVRRHWGGPLLAWRVPQVLQRRRGHGCLHDDCCQRPRDGATWCFSGAALRLEAAQHPSPRCGSARRLPLSTSTYSPCVPPSPASQSLPHFALFASA
jgi:hypothetical protein